MAFDALNLSIIADELKQMLVGGKITKVYQPEKDEVVLFVFNGKTYKLLISANAAVNRIHVTEMPTENPKTAPSFCMLLRKHVIGAEILSVSQMPFERVLDFALTATDDLGYKNDMHLIFELTGKTSNIILTDGNYKIADSIKHLPQDMDSSRIILAGATYRFFEPQNKIAPNDLARIGIFLADCKLPLRKALCDNLLGLSQATVNELTFGIDENDHSVLNNQLVLERIAKLPQLIAHKKPNVVLGANGSPTDVCPWDFEGKKGEKLYFETLNAAHDNYFYLLDQHERIAAKAKSVSTIVKNAVSRTEKKLAIQRQSVLEAENRDELKNFGDLVLSNLWQIKPKQTELTCIDYQTGEQVTIKLDPQLNAQQNAQAYYKKYRKQKSSAEHNAKLVEENEKLLEYLLTIKQNLRFCTDEADLEQIRTELVALGLTKENKTKQKGTQSVAKPIKYVVNGFTVYVGKNNAQNNEVTFKLAKPGDIWLHTQKIHSSHVVILKGEAQTIPNEVIVTAAEICAFFSQAQQGSKIAVDYTDKANVKKPPHAPLGFVIYPTYNTILVDPDRHVELIG